MPSKRQASKSLKSTGRSAKAAKIADLEPKAATIAEPEPEQETGLKFVSELLEFTDASPSSADMLKAALPHAVGTPPSERHTFQKAVVDTFKGLCTEAHKAGEAAVQAAEGRLSSLESEKSACGEKLAEAVKAAEQKAAAKLASEKAGKEAEASLAVAEAAAQAEKDKSVACEKEVEEQVNAKAVFELEFNEVFEALKEGRYMGKEWGLRQKAIKKLVSLMEQSKAAASLIAAVQLSLKDKPEARSDFGAFAVDSTQEVIKAHIEQLEVAVSSKREAAVSQGEVVASADESVKSAKENLDGMQNNLISAGNEWLECDTAATEAKNTLQELERADPKAEVDAATASLERLRGLIMTFNQVEGHAEGSPMEEVKEIEMKEAAISLEAEVNEAEVKETAISPGAEVKEAAISLEAVAA